MTLLFIDGFDAADYATRWTSITNVPTLSTTVTRFGVGRSIVFPAGGSVSKAVPASAKLILGFGYRPTNNTPLCLLSGDSGVTAHISVHLTAGVIELRRGTAGATTVLATSTAAPALNAWHFLEVSGTVADTGGRVIVRNNGETVIDFTGDTRNGGTSTMLDQVTVGYLGATFAAFNADDVYVCNDLGTVNNNLLGDCRVQTLFPTAPGSSTGLAPTGSATNWQNVDDVPGVTTTYNGSAVVGARDTYNCNDLAGTTPSVIGVQMAAVGYKSDAGVSALKTVLKSGETLNYGPTWQLPASAALLSTPPYELNPSTGAPWTVAEINGLEIGAEVA